MFLRTLSSDMFCYVINSVTSLHVLHPAIQDPSFSSRQCLQERVGGEDKQSISLCANALHQSDDFKGQSGCNAKLPLQTLRYTVRNEADFISNLYPNVNTSFHFEVEQSL